LTLGIGGSITRLTDEGGGAAGDEASRSKEIAEKLAEMLMGPGYGLVSKVSCFG
jgi:hypothetical protein